MLSLGRVGAGSLYEHLIDVLNEAETSVSQVIVVRLRTLALDKLTFAENGHFVATHVLLGFLECFVKWVFGQRRLDFLIPGRQRCVLLLCCVRALNVLLSQTLQHGVGFAGASFQAIHIPKLGELRIHRVRFLGERAQLHRDFLVETIGVASDLL